MAIINTVCTCGELVTVRSGEDAQTKFRRDGKQVIYTVRPLTEDGREYDIFRCDGCHNPISETCDAAKYE